MRRILIVLLVAALLVCLVAAAVVAEPSDWKGIPAIVRLERRLEQLNGAECATEILQAATRTHQFEVRIRCDR